MNDNVKVRIVCTETVRYDQTVEMSMADWKKIKNTPESRLKDDARSPLASKLDLLNPLGSDGFRDIEMEVVDADDKPVTPPDAYDASTALESD